MALPLYVPFGYITFLVGLLWLFSRHYRSRALRRKPPAAWFPDPHTARDVYISLLSMDPPPSQAVLVAALLARAMTDVKRIMSLKEAKQAMTNLLQKGQVADELHERLLMAEKELDVELSEVVAEADEYSQGWGGVIFSIASEALQATMCQEIYKNIPKQRTLKCGSSIRTEPGRIADLGIQASGTSRASETSPASIISPALTSQASDAGQYRAAQAKIKAEEEKKPVTTPPTSSGPKSFQSPGSSRGDQSDSDNEGSSSLLKSAPPSASKKKKPKKKKKN
ncbi:hypothetical protein KEM48_013077 [Puccinia striiformis f. sp. tritici PST-130]|nr:hypothetical protein KEM48_013077 [Puccinia striiformis f. sp. tritici PST-130]